MVYDSASTAAIAQWTAGMAPAYATFVHDATAAIASKDLAERGAARTQRDAQEAADDAQQTAARPLEDTADTARFNDERAFIEAEEQTDSLEVQADTAAQGAYDVAVSGLEDQEEIEKLTALKATALAKLKANPLTGPFKNILEFSDEGGALDAGVPTGPEVGSDGYPVATGSSSGTTGGSTGGTTTSSTGGTGSGTVKKLGATQPFSQGLILTRRRGDSPALSSQSSLGPRSHSPEASF